MIEHGQIDHARILDRAPHHLMILNTWPSSVIATTPACASERSARVLRRPDFLKSRWLAKHSRTRPPPLDFDPAMVLDYPQRRSVRMQTTVVNRRQRPRTRLTESSPF